MSYFIYDKCLESGLKNISDLCIENGLRLGGSSSGVREWTGDDKNFFCLVMYNSNDKRVPLAVQLWREFDYDNPNPEVLSFLKRVKNYSGAEKVYEGIFLDELKDVTGFLSREQ